MRIRLAIPDQHVTAPVLDAALEATTLAGMSQMRAGEAPTFTELLRSGVRWRPENFADGEHFDLPAVCAERGWADCDDLAPSLAAELRAKGFDPGARARVIRSGPERWHAIVETSDGRIIDPSVMAGMKARGTPAGIRGAIARPMVAVGESGVALALHNGRSWARTDVPWGDGHLASVAASKDPLRALDASIEGALACGACVGWAHAQDRTFLASLYDDVASGAWRSSGAPTVRRFA